MAIFIVPVREDLRFQSFFVILDGATFKLDFDWNIRTNSFFFSIADVDEVPILTGRQLVPDIDLLTGVSSSPKPAGQLLLSDTRGTGNPPVFGELGTVYELLYTEAETIASL